MFAMPFYAMLFSPKGDIETQSFIITMMSYMMIGLLLLIFSQTICAMQTQMALSMGCTRRNWYAASVVTRVLFALLVALAYLFVFAPFGQWATGVATTINLAYMPLFLCAAIFLVCLGGFIGYIAMAYGGKWMTFVFFFLLALSMLSMLSIVVIGLNVPPDVIFSWLQHPLPAGILLALSALMEICGWRLIRRAAVKI